MGIGSHGKSAKLVGFGKDLSPFFRNATAKGALKTADKSLWGDAGHTYQGTTQDAATIAAAGLFADNANELQAQLELIFGTNGNAILLPDGYGATGRDFVAVNGTCQKQGGESKREDMVTSNTEFLSQIGLDIGRTLNALTTPIVAAGMGTAVDFGIATAKGGRAFLECLAFAGTSNTVTIEDSADGSTGWGTIGTFLATTTGAGKQQCIPITGAVKRYIRMVSTGTFTNFEAVVGFSKYAD